MAENYIEPASKERPLDVSPENLKFHCHSVFSDEIWDLFDKSNTTNFK